MVVAVLSAGGSILVGYPLPRCFYHCRMSGGDHYAGGAGVGSGILTTGATQLSPLLKISEEWGG